MEESLAWFEKGVAFYEKSKFRDAAAAFDKALSLNPSLAEAWNNRGLALIRMERYREAIESFDRALAINPRHPNAKRAREISRELLADEEPKPGPQAAQQPESDSGATGTVTPANVPGSKRRSLLVIVSLVIIGVAVLIVALNFVSPSLFALVAGGSHTAGTSSPANPSAQVSIVRLDPNNIRVTYLGGDSEEKIIGMTAVLIDSSGGGGKKQVNSSSKTEPLKIGSAVTLPSQAPETDRLVVTVETKDGGGGVIYDNMIKK
jgi:tetratricopeptide (TPR) repeat protein